MAMGFLKLLFVLIRNQLWLKSCAWPARRQVHDFLVQQGWSPREVSLSLGLAEPEMLGLTVIFATDKQLAAFQSSGQLKTIDALYRKALAQMRYPGRAIPLVPLALHSHEEIMRRGGYRFYFQ